MGSNNNNNKSGRSSQPTLPADDRSNNTDPKGAIETATQHQVNRFEDQQGPLAQAMGYNYGRGSEANYGDYTDIMNQYRSIASGGGSSGGGGGGGGGGGAPAPTYNAFTVAPKTASYTDPFKSYAGYEDFSKTGGYSDQDMSNMRARGLSPIRAAYANAEQNVQRQRSLQGGYSPNAAALQAKMAREQGQSMADASQNTEANLAQMRQQGRLAGLGGMSGIETSRLGADVDLSKYNTGLDYQSQVYNSGENARVQNANNAAAQNAAASSAAAASQSTADRLAALRGMTSLYGTNPGMSETFGNQALGAVNSGANFGLGVLGRDIQGQGLPGQFDQTMNRVGQIAQIGSAVGAPIANYYADPNRNRQPYVQSEGSGVDEYR